jgi:hypothetical protein
MIAAFLVVTGLFVSYAVAQVCVTPPTGMVSWWPGDENANDIQGAHHGALQNGATFAPGKVGQAFDLDGLNDFVQVADSSAWDFGTNDFTIDLWVNFDQVDGARTFVAHDDGPFNLNKWIFWLRNGQLEFHINDPVNGPIFFNVPFSPTTSTWYHVAVTRSGSTYTFYINGNSAGSLTNSTPVPNASANLTIGWAEGSGTFLDGRLDEVDIFARALSAGEILAIYTAGNAGKCKVAGTTERVSVATDGTEGNAGGMNTLAISADGRFVAFSASASNLVAGDTNGVDDVFVHDRQTGVTERVSVASDGSQANGVSRDPRMSADGRYVVFPSFATNLVPDDTNGEYDVFVRDRQAGTTERVSVASDGSEPNGFCQGTDISGDGRYVAFDSFATNLVAGDTNGLRDIFVRDRQLGTTELVSVNAGDTDYQPRLNADGRYVAFFSRDPVTGGVLVRDRMTQTTERANVNSQGQDANDLFSQYVAITPDGRFVVFGSHATNLVTGDTNGRGDVFLRDRQLGTTERVNVASGGSEANAATTFDPVVSADGRFVVFSSYATNLVTGGTNGQGDVFLRDRQLGTTERVSVSSVRAEGNGSSATGPEVSADGRFVAFSSFATNLVPGDTNGEPDVFVRDRYGVSSENTPVGSNIEVQPVDTTTGTTPVTLTFSTVDQGGHTSLTTSEDGPPPPEGFRLGFPPTYYDITTTASFSDTVEVCIDYSGIIFSDESQLQLFHFEDPNWIDRTVSLDTDNDIICGVVDSLSPFAIFEGTDAQQLVALAPARLWIGLKNSDDQGTQFDLRAEVYVNGTLVSAGVTRCITGVTRNPSKAKEVTVPFGPIADAPGDVVSLKVLTRIGTNPDNTKCPGHNNAVGLRLYYDAVSRASQFGAEITPEQLTDFFLRSAGTDFLLDAIPPTAAIAKFKDSPSLNFSGGNPWKAIGTWSMTLP